MTGAGQRVIPSESALDGVALQFEPAPWTQIPVELINDHEITVQARFLYVKLRSYENQQGTGAYPKVATLAESLGCSERSIQRYLQLLVERGWLLVRQQFTTDGRQRANLYFVLARRRETESERQHAAEEITAASRASDPQEEAESSVVAGEPTPTPVSPRPDTGVTPPRQPRHPAPTQVSPSPRHQCHPLELEPRELPPPTTAPARRDLVVVARRDGDGRTVDAARRGPDPAQPLADAVRSSLPAALASTVAAGPLLRECRSLLETGATPTALASLTRSRPWYGAGPGAVIAWLRADAARELAEAAHAAATNGERTAQRDFDSWRRTQPDCPHGTPGGDLPRPASGTPACAMCRAGQQSVADIG